MFRVFTLLALGVALLGCGELTESEKCEAVTDEMCEVINECAYIVLEECDDYYDAARCNQMDLGDDWEQCYDDLGTMTCRDSYPPGSCESISWSDYD